MRPEQDLLVDLASVVADGGAVDWGSARSSAGSLQDANAIRQLEVVAAIARLHREAGAGPRDSAGDDAPDISDPSARRWGPLVVLEQLGSGSFGDVYRAWDTSLDREVALKLLRRRPGDSMAESIAREGQLLARIHHSNVMAIYGAQVVEGQVGIWGEFLRGRTLAQAVADSGPFSADETLVFAHAICRALAAAHLAGLLHRDVKAQNVIREKGGRIVLMDFGLGRDVNSDAATEFELAGTPLYLAPELFTGARASAQSDLYSLGVLTFFLVTGAFPVTGGSLDEIAAAHAAGRRQRLQDLRPDLPAPFVHIVERALDPDPSRRFESAGAMDAAIASAEHRSPASDGARSRIGPWWIGGACLTALVAGSVTTTIWMQRRVPVPPRPISFAIDAPPGTQFSDSSNAPGSISPDGQSIAFSATDIHTGVTRLWLHSLRTMATTVIPQSESSAQVFWSPDSTAVAFFSAEGLKRVTLGGVRSDAVAAASEPRGGAWNSEGVVLFAQGPRTGLYRVSATGEVTTPQLVIEPDRSRGELGYLWPQFLPDGHRFIYFVLSNDDNVRGIYLGSLNGDAGGRIVASDASAVFAAEHLLFVRDGNLAVQRFDVATGRVEGEATTLVPRVATSFDYSSVVSAASDGTVVYRLAEFTRLARYDRQGALIAAIDAPPARYRSPAISLSNRYLAVQQYRDTQSQLTIFDLLRGGTAAIISRGTGPRPALDTEFPVWGLGDRLVYASSDFGWLDIFSRGISPGDPPTLLLRSETDKIPTSSSPDGRFIAFHALGKSGSYDLWILPTDDGAKPYPLVDGPSDEGSGRFSPDGKRIAYVSNESGALEVWVRGFPNPSAVAKVSLAGGLDPEWISNEELSFLDRTGHLMTVRLPAGPGTIAPPVQAFVTGVINPSTSRNHLAWMEGGASVLINEPAPENDRRIRVMAHWLNPSVER